MSAPVFGENDLQRPAALQGVRSPGRVPSNRRFERRQDSARAIDPVALGFSRKRDDARVFQPVDGATGSRIRDAGLFDIRSLRGQAAEHLAVAEYALNFFFVAEAVLKADCNRVFVIEQVLHARRRVCVVNRLALEKHNVNRVDG